LDRDTFRITLAQSAANRTGEIQQALRRVEGLAGLTQDQFDRISDTVEIFSYNPGNKLSVTLIILVHFCFGFFFAFLPSGSKREKIALSGVPLSNFWMISATPHPSHHYHPRGFHY
jgi:hypothetical protein